MPNPLLIAITVLIDIGKSTFIKTLCRISDVHVVKTTSAPKDLTSYQFQSTGESFYLVNTPSFDDSEIADHILEHVLDWLQSVSEKMRLLGFIDLRRSIEARQQGETLSNLKRFCQLRDTSNADNVFLATTMWSLDEIKSHKENALVPYISGQMWWESVRAEKDGGGSAAMFKDPSRWSNTEIAQIWAQWYLKRDVQKIDQSRAKLQGLPFILQTQLQELLFAQNSHQQTRGENGGDGIMFDEERLTSIADTRVTGRGWNATECVSSERNDFVKMKHASTSLFLLCVGAFNKKRETTSRLDRLYSLAGVLVIFPIGNDSGSLYETVHQRRSHTMGIYRCFAVGCREPEKDWPRNDNFESHLERSHPKDISPHSNSSPEPAGDCAGIDNKICKSSTSKRAANFFVKGKIFAMPWHEAAGKYSNDSISKDLRRPARFAEPIFSHIRRIEVIRKSHGNCWFIPINTFSGHGVSKKLLVSGIPDVSKRPLPRPPMRSIWESHRDSLIAINTFSGHGVSKKLLVPGVPDVSKQPQPRPPMMSPDDDDDDDTIGFRRATCSQRCMPLTRICRRASHKCKHQNCISCDHTRCSDCVSVKSQKSSGGQNHDTGVYTSALKHLRRKRWHLHEPSVINLWRAVIAQICGQIASASTITGTTCAEELVSFAGSSHPSIQMTMKRSDQKSIPNSIVLGTHR